MGLKELSTTKAPLSQMFRKSGFNGGRSQGSCHARRVQMHQADCIYNGSASAECLWAVDRSGDEPVVLWAVDRREEPTCPRDVPSEAKNKSTTKVMASSPRSPHPHNPTTIRSVAAFFSLPSCWRRSSGPSPLPSLLFSTHRPFHQSIPPSGRSPLPSAATVRPPSFSTIPPFQSPTPLIPAGVHLPAHQVYDSWPGEQHSLRAAT